jgi:hypothetical protein
MMHEELVIAKYPIEQNRGRHSFYLKPRETRINFIRYRPLGDHFAICRFRSAAASVGGAASQRTVKVGIAKTAGTADNVTGTG